MVDLEEVVHRVGAVIQRVVARDWIILGGVDLDRFLRGVEQWTGVGRDGERSNEGEKEGG